MQILKDYESTLLAALGAVEADKVLRSKDSSKVIREISKELESMGVGLRRELILQDKTLAVSND